MEGARGIGRNASICPSCYHASPMVLTLGPAGAYAKCLRCLSLEFLASAEDLGAREVREGICRRFGISRSKFYSILMRKVCPISQP